MYPDWFLNEFDISLPAEGGTLDWAGSKFELRRGILRERQIAEGKQRHTSEAFSFKWSKQETYTSPAVREATRAWLVARYGDWSQSSFWERFGTQPLVLDAGCGAGLTARLLIDGALDEVRYVGVDISGAVDVAAKRFDSDRRSGAFLQADLLRLPFPDACFDVILSEGVLHHTPCTREAINSVGRLLRPGGLFAFYVYNRKSPIREFTDDYVRAQLSALSPEEAWSALMSLTRLGSAIGELDVTVNVPEDVSLLAIPKGPISLQRLFYWHICKMYYRPEYTLDEMNHVNFDWFAPAFSHRQTPNEVRNWCEQGGLIIKEMRVEDAGITVLATRVN